MPAAMPTTFFSAPASSTPTGSRLVGEVPLDRAGQLRVLAGDDDGRRQAAANLLGVAGPAEDRDVPHAEQPRPNLRRPQEGFVLQPLGQAQDGRPGAQLGGDPGEGLAQVDGRDGRHPQLGPVHGPAHVGRQLHGGRNGNAGQEADIFPAFLKDAAVVLAGAPEGDAVAGILGQQ
jgi:hypothetical protein